MSIDTTSGPLTVPVHRLAVELDVTDEVVSSRRRRVGRLFPFDSTSGPL